MKAGKVTKANKNGTQDLWNTLPPFTGQDWD
jgi:hypothetical protein